ncbi:MAG TPA: hypothetical protein VFB63_32445, partial [Bryobacteraceae bacterium]|nr:hypothetical protein [Bryobacteraceae bacterium]
MKTFILVALIFAPASSAHAVTRTWTGNGSDNFWSTAANWSPSGAPQNGDDLVFPGQANRLSSVNNLAGRRFISLLFNGMIGFGEPGDTLTISGSPIVISNGVSAAHQNGLVRIQLNLILAQNQAFDVTVHRLNLEGDVNLNGHNLLLFPALDSASMTFYGFIHGVGDLTKVGLGMSSFVGVTGNTYEGSMSVNQGT